MGLAQEITRFLRDSGLKISWESQVMRGDCSRELGDDALCVR
jgi:hypothetical protein